MKQKNLQPLEHAFLSLAPLWEGYFNREDTRPQIDMKPILLDFSCISEEEIDPANAQRSGSKQPSAVLRVKGIGLQKDGDSSDRKQEYPLLGEFCKSSSESVDMIFEDLEGKMEIKTDNNESEAVDIVFEAAAKCFSQTNKSRNSMNINMSGNWEYHSFKLTTPIVPLPPSPRIQPMETITDSLPPVAPHLAHLRSSKRRYIPPNRVLDFCKKIIKKRKEKDYKKKKNAKKEQKKKEV